MMEKRRIREKIYKCDKWLIPEERGKMSYRVKISNMHNRLIKTGYVQVFAINFFIAMLSFIGLILRGNGIFTLCNDFNEQQIPFHMLANNALKNGGYLWNWSIDLGSSFVGALGFYVLGSPFAWLSFLFPAKYYPFVTGWLYMMKYATAGMFAFGYIKRFTNKRYAALGAILYAFSGFQSINLLFHHFHDAVAFFPLLLIGYEKLIREGKKGNFALGVCINAFVNYYFFIQEVVFIVIYFLCREGINIWKKRKLIGSCFFEGIIGVGMSAVLFIPSVLFTMQNPRLSRLLSKEYWFYKGNRDFLQIIRTLLFPGELMCSQSCIKEFDWSSWSSYLPMIGITLVICYIFTNRRSWLAKILTICIIATGIPIINSVFGLFSDTNYHRWLYMLILMMSLASAIVMENRKKYPIKLISSVMTCFMIFIVVGSYWWSANKFELILQPDVFLTWSMTGIMGVFLTLLIIIFAKKERNYFIFMGIGITIFSIYTTGHTAQLYHQISYQSSQEYYERIQVFQELELPDSRYRIISSDNTLLMTTQLPGTGSFTSMVNGSIYEFYEALGTSRPIFTPEGPEGTVELVGGKYYLSQNPDDGNKCIQKIGKGEFLYYLYENELVVPIGSTYNTYMTYSVYEQLPKELKGMAMLKNLIIPDKNEEEVALLLKKYDQEKDGKIRIQDKQSLVNERCSEASSEFIRNYNGFKSIITTENSKYAFFSVPYDKGFSAYVNGKKVNILKTNGMMAVPIEKGKNEITFIYTNYDLLLGSIISVIFICLWIYYRKSAVNANIVEE